MWKHFKELFQFVLSLLFFRLLHVIQTLLHTLRMVVSVLLLVNVIFIFLIPSSKVQ